jgi:hypothetical protein
MPANGANIAALCHRAWSLSSHIHVPTRWSLPETLRATTRSCSDLRTAAPYLLRGATADRLLARAA